MKIGIFYGSTTGMTASVSKKIANLLNADIMKVTKIDEAINYDFIILATSTWGMGKLQKTWEKEIEKLKEINLAGKKIAIIGTGDQVEYSDTFVNGMGTIYDVVIESGAEITGETSIDGYTFNKTSAIRNEKFVGLVIDDVNQSTLTDERIKKWVEEISK